uniref:Thymosin beta n=1 Tax=Erpetoichthys calabaricus TaxID=27687 RepID=A0A8C4SIC6_ERPCA
MKMDKPSLEEIMGFDKSKLRKTETIEKNPLPTKEIMKEKVYSVL